MIVDDIPFERKLDYLVKTVNLPHLLIMSEESVKSLKENKERLESTNEESCLCLHNDLDWGRPFDKDGCGCVFRVKIRPA